MKLNKIPVWNGLINYDYTYIAYLIMEYSENYTPFQKWFAVYDIKKRRKLLDKDFPNGHWRLKRNMEQNNFLYAKEEKYVVLEFDSTKITRKYDNEYPILSKKKVTYFSYLEDVLSYVEKKGLRLNSFLPPYVEGYPLNIRTWKEK
jgi:hypothetical protein